MKGSKAVIRVIIIIIKTLNVTNITDHHITSRLYRVAS